MNVGQLRIGARYILKGRVSQVAVYEGKHTGDLVLADGATFSGGNNALRFRFTDPDGVERLALFDNAGAVEEPEDTKVARELESAALKERMAAAADEAKAFLTGLGFTVLSDRGSWYNLNEADKAHTVIIGLRSESADEVNVDEMTVGKIKQIVGRS